MRTKNFVPLMVVLLLAVLLTLACGDGSDVPAEYYWHIRVNYDLNDANYYCKSYSTEGNTLTISGCYPGDSTKVISGKKWTINSR